MMRRGERRPHDLRHAPGKHAAVGHGVLAADRSGEGVESFAGSVLALAVVTALLGGCVFQLPRSRALALHDISLTIAPGEVVALVGENGSGKTTLAKLLGALHLPSHSRVLWNGAGTAEVERAALRRGAAVIFQDFLRYSLPARDNIAMGRHERAADEGACAPPRGRPAPVLEHDDAAYQDPEAAGERS